jgi:hypothetical protein
MGYATLGFANGPGIQFRIDPQEVAWGFKINTSVTPTVGGRVVQVNGATLADMTINGLFGEDRAAGAKASNQPPPKDDPNEPPGRSWRLAKLFAKQVRVLMDQQTFDSSVHALMHPPPTFSYPPRNWKFRVYVKAFGDPDGGTITFSTGKYSHGYSLTLFIVQDTSDQLIRAGAANGDLNLARQKAINDYLARISDGIGWRPSKYNGNFSDYWDRGETAFSGEIDTTGQTEADVAQVRAAAANPGTVTTNATVADRANQ